MQEAGAHDVEDAAVDRDRGVDDARQRRTPAPAAGARPARSPNSASTPSRLLGADLEAEVAEHDDDEAEQREGQVGLRQEEDRPGDAGAEQHAADQAERAGDERVGRDVAQPGAGELGGRRGPAAEHAAEDVAEAGAEDQADARCR